MPVINSWECPIGDPSDVEELFTIMNKERTHVQWQFKRTPAALILGEALARKYWHSFAGTLKRYVINTLVFMICLSLVGVGFFSLVPKGVFIACIIMVHIYHLLFYSFFYADVRILKVVFKRNYGYILLQTFFALGIILIIGDYMGDYRIAGLPIFVLFSFNMALIDTAHEAFRTEGGLLCAIAACLYFTVLVLINIGRFGPYFRTRILLDLGDLGGLASEQVQFSALSILNNCLIPQIVFVGREAFIRTRRHKAHELPTVVIRMTAKSDDEDFNPYPYFQDTCFYRALQPLQNASVLEIGVTGNHSDTSLHSAQQNTSTRNNNPAVVGSV